MPHISRMLVTSFLLGRVLQHLNSVSVQRLYNLILWENRSFVGSDVQREQLRLVIEALRLHAKKS